MITNKKMSVLSFSKRRSLVLLFWIVGSELKLAAVDKFLGITFPPTPTTYICHQQPDLG